MSKLELLVDGSDRCGEGPIWDFRANRLLWTDIPADGVYEWRDGKKSVLHRGTNVSTIALARDGGLAAGGAGGVRKGRDRGGGNSIGAGQEGRALASNGTTVRQRASLCAGTVYWGA